MAYERPQVTVDQNMTITPTSIERDQPAFVFGPNYELHRYGVASEKSGIAIGVYEAGKTRDVKYPGAMNAALVDKGYTKLFGDNVVVRLAELGDADLPEQRMEPSELTVNGGYTILFFADKKFVDRDQKGERTETPVSLPKNMAVGDLLRVSYKYDGSDERTVIYTKVSAVEYWSTARDMDDSSSSYEETGPGSYVTIEDAIPEGIDLASVTADLVEVFDGQEFSRKNWKAYAEHSAHPGYQWEQKKVIVDGKTVDGVHVETLALEVRGYFDKDTYCPVIEADLYLEYRELLTAYADAFHSLVGSSEVANVLGDVSQDNPLAQGVYMAALNSTTDDGNEAPPIYFMAVGLDDNGNLNWDAVLNRATLTDRAYVFAPTTSDAAVLEKVRSHVLKMSTKTQKMWRIATVSAEIPSEVCKLDAALDPQGDPFYAIPVADGGTDSSHKAEFTQFRVVTSASDTTRNPSTSFRSTLVVGDKVKWNPHKNEWQEDVWDEYEITAVVNNYTVAVDRVITVSDSDYNETLKCYGPKVVEAYHEYTSTEMADEVAKASKKMASRRMYNIFPSQFKTGGELMPGYFAACAVAGLISATEPQQPITNVTVRGIDEVPMVYQTYNKAELDTMAAGGTFIIAQDLPGDLVYVRHQISTAYPDGNLNTAELSITKNVDNISYAFAQTFRPYYGKYNIFPDLLATFRNLTTQLCDEFAGSDSAYGPQLIADETEILYIRQNQLKKDHADVGIRLGVPYPCNNIDIVLTV